jgi:DMSO/TMAO reductase YedYZ molybdopterin-dependent catalytic subunit
MQEDEAAYLADRQDAWEAAVRAEHGLSRREALKLAAAGAIFYAGGSALAPRGAFAQAPAATTPTTVPGILKAQSPELLTARGTNSEMLWASMKGQGYHTPVDRFFVRNHTVTPTIDPATWSLKLFGDGLVGGPGLDAPVTFTLDDLQKLEQVEVETAIECAGNGRSFFGSQQGRTAPGSAWTLGAIGVARWKGVRLRDVLERAGLRRGVADVMPIGLDGEVVANGVNQGHVRRPLPFAKAMDNTIIAFEMNGQTLPADHGFPARLVVPGWVGIANTKWLGFIQVSLEPLFSTWNTTQYRLVGDVYPANSPPLKSNPLKSAFELPFGAVFPVGHKRTLTGRSWSGRAQPARVDVSTDGGQTYRKARLKTPNVGDAWVRWAIDWTPTTAGKVNLLARATDRDGHTQPLTTPFNRDGYWFDAVVKHGVTITA